ncbi:peptide chain release factor 1 [Peptococcaceae bacterium CEB3]|nr:peptide chain release factor 1 [Peptococcaceae bacterium CEB3]
MRELLFSITKKDFKMQYFCAGGPGGQHQNKTASACRIVHPASGAVGESREERSQHQNRKIAFERLVKTREFQHWYKIEVARRLGRLVDAEKEVEKWMQPENLKVEGVGENGCWVEMPIEENRYSQSLPIVPGEGPSIQRV